ncbi:hypothetical protein ACFW4M_31585 [Streptomyces sp. NPDC058794]|uniref:hypothetical protein n=1 Tax=unclassified Streptomyces TaxID=2593676 RepID=UPI00369D982B
MSGSVGKARVAAAGSLFAVLLVAALSDFMAGAVAGEEELDVAAGRSFAAVVFVLAMVATAGAWWWTRRRAARFGLSASRYMRVGRQIQRGKLPKDPAERPAAIGIATRQRRVLSVQSRRRVWWLLGAAALLWLANAVAQLFAHNYGYACFSLLVGGLMLINPLSMRRQRRRMEAVGRALHAQARQEPPATLDEKRRPTGNGLQVCRRR